MHVRRYLELEQGNNGGVCNFNDYDEMEIAPHHLHRSKRDHKLAIFTLSKDIARTICSTNGGDSRIEEVLAGIATKVDQDVNHRP